MPARRKSNLWPFSSSAKAKGKARPSRSAGQSNWGHAFKSLNLRCSTIIYAIHIKNASVESVAKRYSVSIERIQHLERKATRLLGKALGMAREEVRSQIKTEWSKLRGFS